MLDRHATPSNIDDRGTFTELKKSVNKSKAEKFFRLVFKDDYVPLCLPIYSEDYLRDFIFSGGKDPYLNVIEVEQTSAHTPDEAREYNKPKVVVVKLTDKCFLQFIVDEKDGTLHYVKLPKSKADEAFGPALDILMDKHICNYTARLLRSITGLDNRTISNMKKGENLTKSNVISACLGIHIPFRVSNHMLSLADLTLNMTSKGQVGDDNETYDMLLHLKWTTDYDDIYEELKVQSKDHLIHQPPVKK